MNSEGMAGARKPDQPRSKHRSIARSAKLIDRARDLRQTATETEQEAWRLLRTLRLGGFRFRSAGPQSINTSSIFVARSGGLSWNWTALYTGSRAKPGGISAGTPISRTWDSRLFGVRSACGEVGALSGLVRRPSKRARGAIRMHYPMVSARPRVLTPSPVSPRLMTTPVARHPLPQGGEGRGIPRFGAVYTFHCRRLWFYSDF